MAKSKLVTVEINKVERATDLAMLVKDQDGNKVWIPYSLITEVKDMSLAEIESVIGDLEEITIPEWVALQRGLI